MKKNGKPNSKLSSSHRLASFRSLSMALSIRELKRGLRRRTLFLLAATFALGILCLGIKGIEYLHHFREALFPGLRFADSSISQVNAGAINIFMSLYFVGTGLHAIHLTIGLCLIAFVSVRLMVRSQDFNIQSFNQLLLAYFLLLVLLAGAMIVPSLHLGVWSAPASFAIAACKAFVIARVFMEIRKGSWLFTFAFLAGILWLFLLFFIGALDVTTRPSGAY